MLRAESVLMAFSLTLALSASANATPIRYNLTFHVDELHQDSTESCGAGLYRGFDCRPSVGNQYFGYLVLQDSALGQDGTNLSAPLLEFYVEIEGIVWQLTDPYPGSYFFGFRGPGDSWLPYYELGGVQSPGLDILGGELVNLRGGVFSHSDVPFIDFTSPLCGTGAEFEDCLWGVGKYFANDGRETGISGRLTITRVAEPGALTLTLSALFLLAARMRQRADTRYRLPGSARPSAARLG